MAVGSPLYGADGQRRLAQYSQLRRVNSDPGNKGTIPDFLKQFVDDYDAPDPEPKHVWELSDELHAGVRGACDGSGQAPAADEVLC